MLIGKKGKKAKSWKYPKGLDSYLFWRGINYRDLNFFSVDIKPGK